MLSSGQYMESIQERTAISLAIKVHIYFILGHLYGVESWLVNQTDSRAAVHLS